MCSEMSSGAGQYDSHWSLVIEDTKYLSKQQKYSNTGNQSVYVCMDVGSCEANHKELCQTL